MNSSFVTRIKRFSPCLCRLLARKRHGKPLTDQELAVQAGLPVAEVRVLSQLTDWRGVDVFTLLQFTKGCGIDLASYQSTKRVEVYLRSSPTFRYLRRSPQWETFYKPLITKWMNANARKSTTPNPR